MVTVSMRFFLYFMLDFLFYQLYTDSEYISVNETSGLISISEIDRDALKQEVFPFHVSSSSSFYLWTKNNILLQVIAYKAGNESWAITGEAVLIVDDVNDNYPEIEIVPNEIEILENTYLTLPLDRFIVNDIDLV